VGSREEMIHRLHRTHRLEIRRQKTEFRIPAFLISVLCPLSLKSVSSV
jgi:hypothetical protein